MSLNHKKSFSGLGSRGFPKSENTKTKGVPGGKNFPQAKNFNERCYKLLSTVPSGKVTTYKALAEALGCRAYRAVGNAMNKNPYPRDVVPCHRVVNTDGRLGGYAGRSGEKIKRLKDEGVEVKNERIVDFKNKLYSF